MGNRGPEVAGARSFPLVAGHLGKQAPGVGSCAPSSSSPVPVQVCGKSKARHVAGGVGLWGRELILSCLCMDYGEVPYTVLRAVERLGGSWGQQPRSQLPGSHMEFPPAFLYTPTSAGHGGMEKKNPCSAPFAFAQGRVALAVNNSGSNSNGEVDEVVVIGLWPIVRQSPLSNRLRSIPGYLMGKPPQLFRSIPVPVPPFPFPLPRAMFCSSMLGCHMPHTMPSRNYFAVSLSQNIKLC
ncbi:hypothetical protein BDP67DRAFT_486061 [Colletotrichum lupini]|nr:hypothetical protein BDP67DRAFT_486061 [Colletotrichum lupini]